jgi:hypothetical protein
MCFSKGAPATLGQIYPGASLVQHSLQDLPSPVKAKLDRLNGQPQALRDLLMAQFIQDSEIEDCAVIGANPVHALAHDSLGFLEAGYLLWSLCSI